MFIFVCKKGLLKNFGFPSGRPTFVMLLWFQSLVGRCSIQDDSPMQNAEQQHGGWCERSAYCAFSCTRPGSESKTEPTATEN